MSVFDKIYLMYYFLVLKDKNFSKRERVLFLIETLFSMLLAGCFFVFFGLFNIRIDTPVLIVTALSPIMVSYFVVTYFYSKTRRDDEILKQKKNYTKKQRKVLAVSGLLILLCVFVLMFCSAILMSYLWGIHEGGVF